MSPREAQLTVLSIFEVIFFIGKRRNFRKYSRSTIDSLGTKYDYGSIMHYGSKAFSKNGRVTIKVKRSGVCN